MSFHEFIHTLLISNPEAIRVAAWLLERAPRPQTLWFEALQMWDGTAEGCWLLNAAWHPSLYVSCSLSKFWDHVDKLVVVSLGNWLIAFSLPGEGQQRGIPTQSDGNGAHENNLVIEAAQFWRFARDQINVGKCRLSLICPKVIMMKQMNCWYWAL